MTRFQWIRIGYWLLALVALLATWSQNLHYFANGGAGAAFILDLKVNPAARSISVDIGLFFLAAAVFMVSEARRLGVRFVWLYILGGLLIAISVTFPLFLAAREMKSGAAGASAKWTLFDIAAFAALAALVIGLGGFILAS
ncbi:MAG: DUF2834 domain-containing protein [Alphaproteobacteria bacterium]|nr:DUF2834 domain-containing protein [Alphaproteobacteria bacterium]